MSWKEEINLYACDYLRNKMPVLLVLFNHIVLKEPLCAAPVHRLILCLTGADRANRLWVSGGIVSRDIGKGKENQTFASTTYQLSDHWLSLWSSPKQGDCCLHSIICSLAQFTGVSSYFLEGGGAMEVL